MKTIDQHTAIKSLEQALVPATDLIDARTEMDRLRFLAGFGSLINFYNNNNTIEGNWAPFLLKDPVILVASIAKTDYASRYARYQATCINLQQLFAEKKRKGTGDQNIVFSLNQLFNQLTAIFLQIEHWTYFMQLSAESYDLKNYTLLQVQTKFSAIFLSLYALRGYLNFSQIIPGIEAPAKINFQSTHSVWLENNSKKPFWEVLDDSYNEQNPINKDNPENEQLCFDMLKKTGAILFDFFNTIIVNSPAEFERLSFSKSKYPDTTLIRAFVYLLKTQQAQLNRISEKHLEFYFKDILKQREQPAKPDIVYICAQLSNPDAVFQLPKDTLFNAGNDMQQNPILFASVNETNLNPAAIVSVQTLARAADLFQPIDQTDHLLASLYLHTITDTAIIKKDEAGNILSWETFGGAITTPEQKIETGIVFASPMFYLPEGNRNLAITLKFSKDSNSQSIIHSLYSPYTEYYLSTQTDWYKVQLKECPLLPILQTNEKSFRLAFDLDATEPGIENFLANPDAIEAEWPMLKIIFNKVPGIVQEPPAIESINIEARVKDIRSFVLYNDDGALSTKTPFPLFGSTAQLDSSFIIGNAEIFSKPLLELKIELDWDPLPDNFQDYYQQYNNNLPQPGPSIKAQTIAAAKNSPGHNDEIVANEKSTRPKGLTKRVLFFFKTLFRKQPVEEIKPEPPPKPEPENKTATDNSFPFNNCCFTVDFKLLEAGGWLPFTMKGPSGTITPVCNTGSVNIDHRKSGTAPIGDLVTCPVLKQPALPAPPISYLFWFPSISCPPSPTSSFSSFPDPLVKETEVKKSIINPDPALQQTPLDFTDDSRSGFFKMELKSPNEGFGSAVYPKIVTDIALQNALVLRELFPKKEDLVPAPNTPFVPLVNTMKAAYHALSSHDLTKTTSGYPLQCFYYSPFTRYKVYDNSPASSLDYKKTVTSITGPSNNNDGLPLYTSFNFDGSLFIELSQLLPGNTLNLYFQLARNTGNAIDKTTPGFYYLSKTAWKKLPVLNDDTKNFSCSGIIEFNVPPDIAANTGFMPGNNYWIAIAVANNLSSYSKTIYLNSNGIKLQRSGASFLSDKEIPFLRSNTITKPETAIPQLSTISQPFPSVNGRAAENQRSMNSRVSTRIKTKDRAVSSEDYYRLLMQEFKEIFFSTVFYDLAQQCTNVYLVKSVSGSDAANAFTPYVTECEEITIRDFLIKKSSAFANIIVSNFEFEAIKLKVNIGLKPGFGSLAEEAINQALKIYLSPWIISANAQVKIGETISAAQVAKFISGLQGVKTIERIEFLIKSAGKYIPAINQISIHPRNRHTIFISAENHCINNSDNCTE